MTQLESLLTKYAAYHRDRRNIVTHFIGIPLIVLAVVVLLARPTFELGGFTLCPAVFLAAAAAVWYLTVDFRLGIAMFVFLSLCVAIAIPLAAAPTSVWLGSGIALFVVGWIIQFVGHGYEGRKPAFLDDMKSLLVGPLFVMAELAFLLGMRKELQSRIEAAHP
ncbi:DUF962 domain-containing protein [Paraurantiacibacter namhicola]|uniref:DUF962 domain-containing protein n=1 Tax=Paraurantiacibacter namhicola TaxID=645517 RepID=A0A1C7D8S3_9SPHN|nr:Mpo1-like protein [Paraurantiacibacter namhicola]ANU07752.1 hypothetical protein A6F65_01447 [Paraurantiacibacter namhicola]